MDEQSGAAKSALNGDGQTPAEEARCRRAMGRLRLESGMAVLFTAMGGMMLLVLLDIFFTLRSELVSNAFEAFKLVTVTVLGYIFGANQSLNGPEG